MTNEEIRDLVNLVKETGIYELEVQNGDSRVRIQGIAPKGNDQQMVLPAMMPVPVGAAQIAQPAVGIAAPEVSAPSAPPAAPADDRVTNVKSPIVGTYYDAPSPADPPFVKVGDRVHSKQVLCIIESMKLMNEIEAEVAGTIVAKLVENGRPVEYGEALFSIRPE